jgi:hypothetical protein
MPQNFPWPEPLFELRDGILTRLRALARASARDDLGSDYGVTGRHTTHDARLPYNDLELDE